MVGQQPDQGESAEDSEHDELASDRHGEANPCDDLSYVIGSPLVPSGRTVGSYGAETGPAFISSSRTIEPITEIAMSQLVAFYDDQHPAPTKGQLEIDQQPISAATGLQSVEGLIRPALVYVIVSRHSGTLLVPFGQYDEWSLRDRYNEAIRILNTLGAATIVCETFQTTSTKRGFRAAFGLRNADLRQERVSDSSFDFRHEGTGSAPRDPRPLTWPDEPGFAGAVSSVLDNGSAEVELKISNRKNHSVTGALGLELKKVGFDLGGSSDRSGETLLRIHATFPTARKAWK